MKLAGCMLVAVSVASPVPVRIAYGEAPPYNYTRDGKAAGFLIDVFEEAASRAGVELQWVRGGSTQENNSALAEGRLDIVPLGIPTPHRRAAFYVSEPWWSEDSILLVRADRNDVNLAQPERLAMPERMLGAAARRYPGSEPLTASSAPAALELVCRDVADAALLGATYIRDLVNSRPASCEAVRLRVLDSPATIELSLVAARRVRSQAELLRGQITDMTEDGTLTEIAQQHPPVSAPHTARMAQALRAQYERRRMQQTVAFLAVLAAASLVIVLRQIRTQRELRAVLSEQLRTARELRESEAALSQRTTELLRSNEDLQAFAYSVSHDLQEPLRNQSIYSELLERRHADALPSDARQYLRVIRSSAIRMQQMMSSLLLYSRAGQADRERQLVDCGELVNRVLRDLDFLLRKADARVEVGRLPEVWAWEDRLQQVFQNLIENAAKYRKPDLPPWITISAEKSGDDWRFAISDNGIGFSQEYADKVFGLFKRLHGQDAYGGSGIGLALCKRIVERHGGRIWVESRGGVGTTFFFTLPAVDRKVQHNASATTAELA